MRKRLADRPINENFRNQCVENYRLVRKKSRQTDVITFAIAHPSDVFSAGPNFKRFTHLHDTTIVSNSCSGSSIGRIISIEQM